MPIMLSARLTVLDWAASARPSMDGCWTTIGRETSTSTALQLLRRRVSEIGQRALRPAWCLSEGEPKFVLASRNGEFGRTLGLLEALTEREPLSPAEFSLSVHHALIGLLSIARGNGAGHTALAAGADSFG